MGVQIQGDTGNVIATKGTYSGNVTIGGTLTYEDVTNIDAVGMITARSGIEIGASPGVGASISVDGNAIFSGITTTGTVQVGSATTVHTTGIDLGSGNLTGHNLHSTGITTSSSVIVGGGVTISESGIEASGIGITVANINGGAVSGRRNIIVNGSMGIAQRGISSTSDGYHTVDRFTMEYGGENEAPEQRQANLTSAAGPYREGHRHAFKITNGNQTGGAGSGDYLFLRTKLEAQDIATSGWDYTQTTSFITLSFWVKSSVAQTFPIRLRTEDGTAQNYSFQYTISSADTWQKVVHTIPGNSNLQFDSSTLANGAALGLSIFWDIFRGTGQTDSSFTNNAWAAYSGTSRTKDQTSTWWTTNDATFFITGVQLEVGPQATRFEHRTYGDELLLCQRYFRAFINGTYTCVPILGRKSGSDTIVADMVIFPPMRVQGSDQNGTVHSFGGYRRTNDYTTANITGDTTVKILNTSGSGYNYGTTARFTTPSDTGSTNQIFAHITTTQRLHFELSAEL